MTDDHDDASVVGHRNVGFIGLGKLGRPMASNILRAGFSLCVNDLRPEPIEALTSAGARTAPIKQLAAEADIIGVCVLNDEQVLEVVTGSDGVLTSARPGTAVVLHSTISPRTCHAVGQAAAGSGVAVVDAAITMADDRGTSGDLIALIGGDPEIVHGCRAYFDAIATRQRYLGQLGNGATAKVIKNTMTMCATLVTWEALALAAETDLGVETMLGVAMATGARSGTVERWPARLRKPTVGPHFEGVGTTGAKDIDLAINLATEAGLAMPVVSALLAILRDGLAAEQTSGTQLR